MRRRQRGRKQRRDGYRAGAQHDGEGGSDKKAVAEALAAETATYWQQWLDDIFGARCDGGGRRLEGIRADACWDRDGCSDDAAFAESSAAETATKRQRQRDAAAVKWKQE